MDPRADDPSIPPDPPGDDPRAAALGRAIKVIRTGLGLGRPELAERAKLSYSYLAEIENGKKQASSAALHAIAKALAMSPSELLAAAEEWAARLAGDEVGATPLREMIAESRAAAPLASDAAVTHYRFSGTSPRVGARERALRWFRDDTATRVWNRSEIEPSSADAAKRRARRAAKDDDLAATLERLYELLRRLSPEDRERILDLARRLAES